MSVYRNKFEERSLYDQLTREMRRQQRAHINAFWKMLLECVHSTDTAPNDTSEE